jgi:hypothetical protein
LQIEVGIGDIERASAGRDGHPHWEIEERRRRVRSIACRVARPGEEHCRCRQ